MRAVSLLDLRCLVSVLAVSAACSSVAPEAPPEDVPDASVAVDVAAPEDRATPDVPPSVDRPGDVTDATVARDAPDARVSVDAPDVPGSTDVSSVDAPDVTDATAPTDVTDATAPTDVSVDLPDATDVSAIDVRDVSSVDAMDAPGADVRDVSTTDATDAPVVVDAGCVAPRSVCGSLMRCVDLQSDGENCGRCDNRCAAGGACSRGGCVTVAQLAGGETHTCARLSDGTVSCWGNNETGQIGDGTSGRLVFRARPTPVAGLTDVAEIAVGRNHACARLSGGAVRCWGNNGSGAVGIGTYTDAEPRAVAVPGITNAVSIAAGWSHSCAALADGTLRCWGSNVTGQVGDGVASGSRPNPTAVVGINTARGVTAGTFHTCAWLADGTATCWGSNGGGQLGNGTTVNSPRPVAVSALTNVASLAAGSTNTCALRTDGSALCWGSNGSGQVGDGTTATTRSVPTAVMASGFRSLTVGNGFACGRSTDDTVLCWGGNRAGQLGDGNTSYTVRMTPAAVVGLGPAAEVAAGDAHVCARARTGAVVCWGAAGFGQLGTGAAGGYFEPQAVPGLSGVTQVIARDQHTCALRNDGTAQCWGQGNSGELGDGLTAHGRFSPAAVTALSGVASLGGGSFHTCARLSDGTVRCWGYNDRGQVGDGSTTLRPTATTVTGIRTATQLALGQTSSCALLADRTVQCWGANNNGRLGRGYEDMFSHDVPAGAVMGLTNASALGMGLFHVCAIRADGTLACWGANDRGQLGDGTLVSRFVATTVPGVTNITQVVGGYQHTCARRGDGAVLCWGYNNNGQCGVATSTAMVTSPAVVAGISDVTELTAGEFFTCARRGDGTVWCWGSNDNAQLGDGAQYVSRPTPAAVPGLSGVIGLAAGAGHACALRSDGTLRCWGTFSSGAMGVGHLVTVRF